jgi:3-oxoacyl-[acyl-carrier protein] reductase
MASEGYNLMLVYAGNEKAADETRKMCLEAAAGAGRTISAEIFKCDVSDENMVSEMISTTLEHFGQIDVLVNNAGITKDSLLARMSTDDFDSVIAANLKGCFLCSRAVTRPMMKKRTGRIINISSIVGIHGNAGQVNYSASKAGIIGLTKSIAKELAGRNITCNAIAPGFVDTEMTQAMRDSAREATLSQIPMKRAGSADDIAACVSFLAGSDASYITGQVIGVDGGMGC